MVEKTAIRTEVTTKSGETLLACPLREGDGPRLQQFDAGLSEESRRLFTPHSYDDATVDRMIRRAETGVDITYLLLAGETVVGYFFLWDIGDRVPVLGIGIADACQNQGLGRQLMHILIEDARRADRDGIELTTMLDNDRAFTLYQKCGFQYLGDVANVTGDGRVVTERAMFLPLKPGATPMEREHKPPE